MVIPTQCHFWQKEQVASEDIQLGKHFELLITLEDDSHLIRCKSQHSTGDFCLYQRDKKGFAPL
jgi:hypothetical protein